MPSCHVLAQVSHLLFILAVMPSCQLGLMEVGSGKRAPVLALNILLCTSSASLYTAWLGLMDLAPSLPCSTWGKLRCSG